MVCTAERRCLECSEDDKIRKRMHLPAQALTTTPTGVIIVMLVTVPQDGGLQLLPQRDVFFTSQYFHLDGKKRTYIYLVLMHFLATTF